MPYHLCLYPVLSKFTVSFRFIIVLLLKFRKNCTLGRSELLIVNTLRKKSRTHSLRILAYFNHFVHLIPYRLFRCWYICTEITTVGLYFTYKMGFSGSSSIGDKKRFYLKYNVSLSLWLCFSFFIVYIVKTKTLGLIVLLTNSCFICLIFLFDVVCNCYQ